MTEGPGLVGGAIGFLVNIAIPLALFAWGRSVANRRGGRGWRVASYLPLVAALASLVGFFFTIVGLIGAFEAVSDTDAASRATVLSQGIATAMWATAIGMGLSIVLYVASIVVFAVGELTKPAAVTPP